MDAVPGQAGRVNDGAVDAVSVEAALADLIRDPSAGAQARASAVRTLAEIRGLLGRHQARPDRASETPVDELSREDLVLELARLRSRVAVP